MPKQKVRALDAIKVKKMLKSARGAEHLLDSNNHRYKEDGKSKSSIHWRYKRATQKKLRRKDLGAKNVMQKKVRGKRT